MNKKIFESHSQEETECIATQLANSFKAPQVIALIGDLGVGKTTFVRAFVRSLRNGDKVRVKSPSFALHHEYQTTPTCHHLDLYRLSDYSHFEDLGLKDIIEGMDGFVLIEWPELIASVLPKNTITIELKEISDTSREIIVSSHHSWHQGI